MKENLDIFGFTLSENEMQQIARLDTGHTCFVPRNTGAAVTAFLEQAVTGSAPSGKVTDSSQAALQEKHAAVL